VNAHVAAAELLAFLRGSLGPADAPRVLSHLARCARCRRTLGISTAAGRGGEGPDPWREQAEPPPQSSERRPRQGAQRVTRIRLLLEQCETLRRSDPREALRLAALARQSALRLAPPDDRARRHSPPIDWARRHSPPIDRARRHSPPLGATDWMARATAEMGNAYRLIGELDAAERCLRQAVALAGRGSGEPLLTSAVADLAASVLADQRRFPAAIAVLTRLHQAYRRLGYRRLAARTLLVSSLVHSYAGEAERALPLLLRALDGLDAAREPQLTALALHNLAKLLLDLGRPGAAARVLFPALRAGKLSPAPLDRLRQGWLAGRIAAALGAWEEAEAAFRRAMEGFAAAGLAYPGALAALDLASLQVRLGRRAEARELLAGAAATFRRLGIAREALASLLLLRRLLATEAASNETLLAGIRRAAARLAELAAQPSRQAAP
jgi:tetratricopeptide (TPR) repeat protein